MAYPVEEGELVTKETWSSCGKGWGTESAGGIFKSEDNQFVMVESGWSGGRCGAAVDVCVASPCPDEASSFAIGRRVLA